MNAEDFFAIHNLIYSYCDCLDRGDFNGMANLFANADFYVPSHPQPLAGPAEIVAAYRENVRIYPETGTPRTRHITTNVMIESDGPDAARTQSYFIVFQATDRAPLQPIIGGRYFDRFVRLDGRWRFKERRIDCDLFGDLSAHLLKTFGPTPQAD